MEIKRILIFLIFIIGINIQAKDAPLINFVSTIDWETMGDKTKFSLDLCKCDLDDNGNGAGLRAQLAEPIGLLEFTNTPWNAISIGKKFDKSLDRNQGSSRSGGGNRRYAHFIAFAPMGALNFIQDAVCFERMSSLSFLYWSEVIPTQTNDVMGLFAQMSKGAFSKSWFNNSIGAAACMADCIYNTFGGQMNSLHWCAGCSGTTGNNTAYGSGRSSDPIAGSHAQALAVIDDLHYGGLLSLVQNAKFKFAPVSVIPNATCGSRYFPIAPKTQYRLNIAYPSVWDSTRIGEPSFGWAGFKNLPGSEDDVAFWVWVIKDTCIGGTKCTSMFTRKTNN